MWNGRMDPADEVRYVNQCSTEDRLCLYSFDGYHAER